MKLVSFFILSLLFSSCSQLLKNDLPVFDKDLTGFHYPFPVEYFKLKSQRQTLEMAYMDLNKESKKVFVLLHGKNFSGFYFEGIANELVAKGYRVIIPDQIGFGKSTKPKNYQYSFYNLAINTNALISSLGIEQYSLLGHSMGGMLATHFTYLYPSKVSKLILINPIGLEPYLKYVEYKDPQFFYNIELKKTPEKFRAYQRKNYYDGKWKKEYDKLLIPYSGQMRGPDWPLVAWNNALTYGPIFSEDITTKFSEIKVPVALIIGTRDRTGPGRNWKKLGVKKKLGDYKVLGKLAAKKITKARLFELAGLGHMPQFEDYEKFKIALNKALQFQTK